MIHMEALHRKRTHQVSKANTTYFSKIIFSKPGSKTRSQMPHIPPTAPFHLPMSRAAMGAASFLPQHCSSKLGHMLWSGSECGQKLDRKIRTTNNPPKPNPLLHTVFMYLSIIRELGCSAFKNKKGFNRDSTIVL